MATLEPVRTEKSIARVLRIVVADDEPDTRRWLEKQLPRLGHEVVAVAKDGKELVVQCLKTRPDLVISDERMPEMNGHEAARLIRSSFSVPFIMFSAVGCADATPDDSGYVIARLVKPVKLTDIQGAIAHALTVMQS